MMKKCANFITKFPRFKQNEFKKAGTSKNTCFAKNYGWMKKIALYTCYGALYFDLF